MATTTSKQRYAQLTPGCVLSLEYETKHLHKPLIPRHQAWCTTQVMMAGGHSLWLCSRTSGSRVPHHVISFQDGALKCWPRNVLTTNPDPSAGLSCDEKVLRDKVGKPMMRKCVEYLESLSKMNKQYKATSQSADDGARHCRLACMAAFSNQPSIRSCSVAVAKRGSEVRRHHRGGQRLTLRCCPCVRRLRRTQLCRVQ